MLFVVLSTGSRVTCTPDPDDVAARALLAELRATRRHRASVRAARGLSVLIAAGLLSVWLLRPPISGGDENRALRAFPEWGPAHLLPVGLLQDQQYRRTDAALRDRLALRRYVTEAIGEAAAGQVGGALSPDVVLGPHGMPFSAEDFTLPCERPFDAEAVDTGLRQLTELARAHDRSVLVAVAPDKSSVLTEQLGPRGPALLSCADQVRRATEATWPAGTGAPVLSSWAQLRAAELEHPGETYQFGDTHWTTQGALVFAKVLLSDLVATGQAPGQLRGMPDAVHAYDEELPGDLYRMIGQAHSDRVPVWKVERAGVTVRTEVDPSGSGRGVVRYRTEIDPDAAGVTHATDVPMVGGTTLVINDSFFSRAELTLAPYFERLTVLHYADFLTAVQNGDLPQFDRLVIETVQRGWPERAGWLRPGQPVHEAIARALVRPKD